MRRIRGGESVPPGFCYLPPHCLSELSWYGAIGSVCVFVGGISESNTVNKREGLGGGEGEERNMEVLFITLVGE